MVLPDTGTPGTSGEIYSKDADGETRTRNPWVERGCEFESHHRHPHCKFLCWYQEFLCPVEPLYFSDEKSVTAENC